MDGRQELAQRLTGWLREKNWAPRRLSLDAGLAENAVGRILERPERETRRETWQKLARYLRWDEREVMALAYGQSVAADADGAEDPWTLLERAMGLLNLPEEYRVHLRGQIRILAQGAEAMRRLHQPNDSPDPPPSALRAR